MSGPNTLTAEERTFCLLYAMHPEDPIGALISAFDVTAIPEKQWGLFCGELIAKEIELEIYVQQRILASSNRARLAAEYEEIRVEALSAGDLVLAASCIAAKAMQLQERTRSPGLGSL
jgi:hypothetical protein